MSQKRDPAVYRKRQKLRTASVGFGEANEICSDFQHSFLFYPDLLLFMAWQQAGEEFRERCLAYGLIRGRRKSVFKEIKMLGACRE
jgi:hypothetical protein